MVRSHQPDEAVFRSVLPEDIEWKPFSAFPPSVRLAIVVWAKSGEHVTQVSAIGPLGLEYLDPGNDPRQRSRHDALAPKPDRVRSRSDTRPTSDSSG